MPKKLPEPSGDTVELGPRTLKLLAALIEEAVGEAIEQHQISPDDHVQIDYISPIVVDEIKRAIHEVLDEREDEESGPDVVS